MTFLDNEIVEGNHVWNVRVPLRFIWACVSSPANLLMHAHPWCHQYNLNFVPPKPRVPPQPDDPRTITSYHPGGSKALEPWSFASLTNEQGPPIDWSEPGSCTTDPCFKGAMNRFVVFRGNKVRSNGGIVIRGSSANVIVEASTIERSDVGIHVNCTRQCCGPLRL